MTRSKTHRNQHTWLFIIVAIVLVGIVGASLYFVTQRKKQPTYFSSNEVKLLEFDSSTGPVSPEYQESKTLIITPTTCSYTFTKIQPQSTTTTSCVMTEAIWDAIVASFESNKVKSILESAPQSSDLLGGPQKQFTAVYANGDTYKAFINDSEKDKLQNFLQQAQAQVPDLSNISY